MPIPETITMNDDGTYRLAPPFIIINQSDQKITWTLRGSDWVWDTPGIQCETTAPNPPYSPWPAAQPALNGSNQYVGDASSPNPGPDWIYYKWTFKVRNTRTGQTVTVDPDIGNEPKP